MLSLFFIDRVANYTASDGLIRRLFDEEFERLKDDYGAFKHLTAAQVRQAYFAKKKQKDGREEDVDTESRNAGEREMEKQAFALIMRDKERLLSFDEPVSFIFAHSALKEGWDNPNVFQICTLNQTVSEIKKRQEIGRGLRLAVNQVGERVHDEEVNVLTVVANESYQNYVGRLQSEYVADGDAPPPAPTNAHLKRDAIRNDRIFFQNEHFEAFWGKLNQRLRYRMHIETPALIEACVMRLNRQTFPGRVLVVERKGDAGRVQDQRQARHRERGRGDAQSLRRRGRARDDHPHLQAGRRYRQGDPQRAPTQPGHVGDRAGRECVPRDLHERIVAAGRR
ncbi:hypothetical protein [Candidatus Amarobacter glycogenicus]|uniref:hypothetical protein n=1 Tax=Candidatus Amarobacter glycogenicus TaxID=3140699 RepID=UPI002A10EDB2|nr:hypothetical protein [Dehalococcoidia bacterium]